MFLLNWLSLPQGDESFSVVKQMLKERMKTEPFAKISVDVICEKCEINHKSFYYHFKDKYELVNWIYYTEFITYRKECQSVERNFAPLRRFLQSFSGLF